MTVRDLVQGAPFLRNIKVIVREHGSGCWIQGFRIGPDAKIHKFERCAEFEEQMSVNRQDYKLKEGESFDVARFQDMPMKVKCVDPRKAPADVLDLVVCHYLPRHICEYHDDNDFDLEIDCYPPEHQEKLATYRETKEAKADDQLEGQMSIEEFLGE